MSDNPYAPPSADLGWERAENVGGRGDFEIRTCLNDAWANTWANFPLWLLVGLVGLAASLLAVLSVIGVLLVLPVLAWGATYFALRMHDRRAEFGDLFAGFSRYGEALVGMVVLFVLLFLVSLIGNSVQILGAVSGSSGLENAGVLVSWVFALFVTSRLTFAYFLVVEGVYPVEAVSRSWSLTQVSRWKVAGLVLLSIVIELAGLLALVVGLIPALAIVYLMWVSAYRQTVGAGAAD
jgi:hypothetical protein